MGGLNSRPSRATRAMFFSEKAADRTDFLFDAAEPLERVMTRRSDILERANQVGA
jgi:hypothetical protein